MESKGRLRWSIVALLFFATTINYIDRQVIGILKPFIASDLKWSESDYGYIVSSFQIAYAAGLVITGRLLDKFGTRLWYTLAVVIWSIAGIAHAAARGMLSFAVARFFLGIGEATNFPAAVKTIAEWFPQKERALAAGWFNSGSTIGAIVAPIIVSGITISLGWRWAFIITGSLGFIWIIFWLKYYHQPSKHPKLCSAEFNYIHSDGIFDEGQIHITWFNLFRYRQTVAICLSRFITDWVWWFFLFWLPDLLHKLYKIDLKEVVFPLIFVYAMASLGGIGGGWLSSKFIKVGRSIDYARKTSILLCALCVLPIMLILTAANLWIATMIIALAAAAHQGWAANIFTVVSDIYPKKLVGSMIGISGFAGAIGGALSASLIGLILQVTGSYFLIFLFAGSSYLWAWIILKWLIPHIRPIAFPEIKPSVKPAGSELYI